MKALDITTFTVASEDGVLGWGIETEFNVIPATKEVLARLVDLVGLIGIENFLDYALREAQTLEIIISSEYSVNHSLSFDPYSAPDVAGAKHDTVFVLFMRMLSTCIEEYGNKLRSSDEKGGVS